MAKTKKTTTNTFTPKSRVKRRKHTKNKNKHKK